MKKLIVTAIAVTGMSLGALAQGTITADNLNGAPGKGASSFGLFYLETDSAAGTLYAAAKLNVVLTGGPNAGSLGAIGSWTGAGGWDSFGGGLYADPNGLVYGVPGVALNGTATLQLTAWRGAAASYAAAAGTDKFYAWNGNAFVDASSFTFQNATGGGGAPPALPKSLDGMPAMSLIVPEPSTIALAGLGAAALLIYRRRQN